MTILLVTAALVLLIAAVLLVRRDYRRQRELSALSVVTVWAAYLFHAGVTAWFAWSAPLGRVPGTAVGAALDTGAVGAMSSAAWTIAALLLGGALAGAGITIAALAIATFRSFQRMSGLDTSRLVTGGLYALSRNPQNVGWALALLGVAVAGRSVLALVMVALFALVLHTYIVRLEEPYLERIYGQAYRDYMERSPRYLGLPGEDAVTGA